MVVVCVAFTPHYVPRLLKQEDPPPADLTAWPEVWVTAGDQLADIPSLQPIHTLEDQEIILNAVLITLQTYNTAHSLLTCVQPVL